MIRTRVLPLIALAAAAAVSLGACGTSSTITGVPAPAPVAAPAAPPAPAAPAGPALTASPTDALGTVVVDGTGFTLYRFDKDKPKPSVSNCNGDCAVTWPPAMASGTVSLKGIDKSLVSTVTRADGGKQLTLGGWPLYRYAPDTKPGDTKGQGVGGTWFASDPQGKKAMGMGGGTNGGTGGGGEYGY
jgi:predicted lipoprotein with Yx(FWY)xxD motif